MRASPRFEPRIAGLAIIAIAMAVACTGPEGPSGPAGDVGNSGAAGNNGATGESGGSGEPGPPGPGAWITGPGLQVDIYAAAIDEDGVATISFRITDNDDTPLDLFGHYTAGAVELRFVLAWLDQSALGSPFQYTAYTTREQTSPITLATATQAASDTGGAFTELGLGEGTYEYQLGTLVDVANPTRTHTVGAFAWRRFDGRRYVANATHHFVPDGSAVATTREVTNELACNQCHTPLAAHDDLINAVDLCVLCHQPQSVDPDTGNSVDMKVMVHKIHTGEELPSVIAGTPYQLIGADQEVFDYSTVAHPRDHEICATCHTGADGDLWMSRPAKPQCGACHDRISWDDPPPPGFELHPGGEILSELACPTCHVPTGAIEAIVDNHYTPATNPANPVVAVTIAEVTATGPGQSPQVTFQVTVDGAARDISAAPLAGLSLTIAGPTDDYQEVWQTVIQGAGATGTLTAVDAVNGIFSYLVPIAAAIPPTATGSYAFALEAYLVDGSSGAILAAANPIAYAAVTDVVATNRRKVIAPTACDRCHHQLRHHDAARTPAYCAMCHQPDSTNQDGARRFEDTTVTAESVDFKVMIHRIHRGDAGVASYLLGANPQPTPAAPGGTQRDYLGLRFSGDLRSCGTCHMAASFSLPLADTVQPSRTDTLACSEDPAADADDYCDTRTALAAYRPPTAAVCTACHDAASTAAHAEVNTTTLGAESCPTCHGPGAAFAITAAHNLD